MESYWKCPFCFYKVPTVYSSILANSDGSFQSLDVRWNWIYPHLRHWLHRAVLIQRMNWLLKQIGRWTSDVLHLGFICSWLLKGNTFITQKYSKKKSATRFVHQIAPPFSDKWTLQTQPQWQANIPETPGWDAAVPDHKDRSITFSFPGIKVHVPQALPTLSGTNILCKLFIYR